MSYRLSQDLPWGRFSQAWGQAEESLARLDQMLRVGDHAEGWMNRAHFDEACASIWLEGGLVPLEDLVLLDANTPIKMPYMELYRARAVLLSRRSLARQSPSDALKTENMLNMQTRRNRVVQDYEVNPLIEHDPAWNTGDRLLEWQDVLAKLEQFPALPAAGIAFRSWHVIEPLQYGNATIGRLLIPIYLWYRKKTVGQTLCLSTGIKELRWRYAPELPLGPWLHEFCRAVEHGTRRGLVMYQRLSMARKQIDLHLEGKRSSSRLPDLANLILERPLVSATMAAKELRISQQAVAVLLKQLSRQGVIRELTGRGRFRAYGIVG